MKRGSCSPKSRDAHGRTDAVAADQHVAPGGPAVGEEGGYSLFVLAEVLECAAQVQAARIGAPHGCDQRLMQVAAVDLAIRRPEALNLGHAAGDVHEGPAVPVVLYGASPGNDAEILEHGTEAQVLQNQ